MYKKICEELKTILKNSKLDAFLGLNSKDLEIICQESRKLSFNEKADLFINFLSPAGTILYDAGGLFEARIKIDDRNFVRGRNRPLAYIKFTNGKKARVEVIDILESVRNDATLIGHPVIIFAIQHWQKILIEEKYSNLGDVYTSDKKYKLLNDDKHPSLNDPIYNPSVENARRNLEEVGKAFLEEAKRQSIPKESALAIKIKELKLEEKNTYLYFAWKRLFKKHIDIKQELDERINEIEKYLNQLPSEQIGKTLADYPLELRKFGYIDSTVTVSSVIDFLKSDGKGFVYSERNLNSLRPRWKVFQNAYIKWHSPQMGTTVEKYRKVAKKQGMVDTPYTMSNYNSTPETTVFNSLYNVLTRPLVSFCQPIECSEKKANSRHFADLINQTGTK